MGVDSNGKALLGALERLGALRKKGHLTDAEFAPAKRMLLDDESGAENTDVSDEVYRYRRQCSGSSR